MELLVYVEDTVLACNYAKVYNEFNIYLNAHFSIEDLGPLTYFLSIEVAWGLYENFFYNKNML